VTPGLIVKRMRRSWRSLTMLLLAVCLLTGFFALGPFYIRAVTDIGLRHALGSAAPQDLLISLIVKDEPLSDEAYAIVRAQLGNLAAGRRHYIRADYTPPTTQGGLNLPQLVTGGYIYRYGEPVTAFSSRTGRAYQPFAFENMPELLTLVAGRWPVRLPPPDAVDPTGLSDAEQQARQIGPYNRGQVEVVITPTVAKKAGLELGSRLVLGTILPDGSGHVASVVVVGIVEPKDPADPIWEGNRNFLEGATVEQGIGQFRYDHGMAALPEAYTDWLADVVPGSSYIYRIETNTSAIRAANIGEVNERLSTLQGRLSPLHPGITVLSGLTAVLQGFSRDVKETEGPIILLSGAVLVLMLYHLVNTVALVLEQQGTEWSTIVSRGGSAAQLIAMQAVMVGVLALVGALTGPLMSIGYMLLLERVGPLAAALGGEQLGALNVPPLSLTLSALAALAAALVLILPAFPAARRSLLRLKEATSRPPTRPAWARLWLDGVLLAIGAGFMLRLYYLVGGRFDHLLNNLIAAPRDVIALIADNLNETGGLNDPFNLLAPALVLTGAAMLWLRLFPALADLAARVLERGRRLTAPLAVWNVARDPGHYAQLVLLLIGTLALGTASLGLSATRDRGAWESARADTGGGARVDVNPAQLDGDGLGTVFQKLPLRASGVVAQALILHAVGDPGTMARGDVHILGVDPAALAAAFPEMADQVAPLEGIAVPPSPGLALPVTARTLTVQGYSLAPRRADDPPVAVQLSAYVQDALGVPYRVRLVQPAIGGAVDSDPGAAGGEQAVPTPVDRWLTFSGPMPTQGRPPYSLMRVGINSRQGNFDAFEHTLYLDRVATLDSFGTATTVASFEDQPGVVWAEARVANPYAASWISAQSNVERVRGVSARIVSGAVEEIDGPGQMRLSYRMGRWAGQMNEPSIVVNEPEIGRISVVVSAAFAEMFAGRGAVRMAADPPLAVGSEKNLVLDLGTGAVEIGYRVVGVLPRDVRVPSLGENDLVMITLTGLIRPVLNQAAIPSAYFDENMAWLELADREPSDALRRALASMSGVRGVSYAWDRYGEIQREPLPSAVAGMLYAGFWISLLLALLDFAFYLVVTARQRAFSFGVLRALGWDAGHLWRLLLIEQAVLITPALVVGSLIGLGLAYLLLPFLALAGGETLKIPWLNLAGMLAALVGSFTALMAAAAIVVRRMSVNQVLRLGEE